MDSWNFMMSGYANAGLVEDARRVFDITSSKNGAQWNAVISAYTRAIPFKEVLELFENLQSDA